MAQRRKGTGSITQRRDGLWVGRVNLGGTPRVRKVFASMDRAEAEVKMLAWLRENRPDALTRETLPRSQNMANARAIATHTEAEWLAKRGADCHHCGRPAPHGVKDHLIPVARGGSDGIENVVLACQDCNAAKGAMTPEQFIEWATARDFFTGPRPLTESAALASRAFSPAQRDFMAQPIGTRLQWWRRNGHRYTSEGEVTA